MVFNVDLVMSVIGTRSQEIWIVGIYEMDSVRKTTLAKRSWKEKLTVSWNKSGFRWREKKFFLKIACLFIRHDRDVVIYVWNEPGYFPEAAMEVLENMSLKTILEDNKMLMHDQLKAQEEKSPVKMVVWK